jgi:hypothetical protein
MIPHLNDVVMALLDLLGGLGCETIARHLHGVQNRLADGISRWLDAGTVSSRLSVVSDSHPRQNSALIRVGRPALPNAVREAHVADVMAVVRRRAKTGRCGRLGLSKAEFAAILRAGFDLSCASGHHRRLALVIGTLGCLRRRAVVHLRVCYTVDAYVQVVFLPSSEAYTARDLDIGGEYIGMRVLADKNIDSRIDANAYIS